MGDKLKAVVFDFDGTLTPNIQPSFKILEASGLEGGFRHPDFVKSVKELASADQINIYHAMAKQICKIASAAGFALTDQNLALGADDRIYNPGTLEILQWLKQNGVQLFLISSGLKNYLSQTEIAPFFTKIYATTFSYNDNGEVTDVGHAMTTEAKAVALAEVATVVNSDPEDFSGIVYVGDGPTDLTAMKHIKQHGGNAILVHLPDDSPELMEAQATGAVDIEGLIRESQGVADAYVLADYTQNSDFMRYLKQLME